MCCLNHINKEWSDRNLNRSTLQKKKRTHKNKLTKTKTMKALRSWYDSPALNDLILLCDQSSRSPQRSLCTMLQGQHATVPPAL